MKARQDQRGFAMLLVFLMAALIAISLYMEIPRVAFESQRNKEQLLIERGEQYKRAIQVFFKANKRYPARMEDLESFNNHRYLRKKYIDPMTGKDEWRLVHIGPGGIFTDSLVNKPPSDKDKKDGTSGSGTTAGGTPGTGTTATTTTAGTTMPGMPGMPGMPYDPNNPNQQPQNSAAPKLRDSEKALQKMVPVIDPLTGQPKIDPATGQPVMQPASTTQMVPVIDPATGQPKIDPTTGQPVMQPAPPGQTGVPGQPGMQPGSPYSTIPGAQGPGGTPFQQPGMTPNGPASGPGVPTDAQKLIQDLLTRPRPAMAPTGSNQPGQTIGGGIAGVASKADAEGIKVYKDHTNYKEWEFLYDYTKDTGPMGTQGSNIGTPAGQLGTPAGQQPGANNPGGSSPFGPGGATPGTSTPFGQPPMPPTSAPITPK